MSLINLTKTFVPKVEFRWTADRGSVTLSYSAKTGLWTESSSKDVRRIDPLKKKLHGYYYAEASFLDALPVVNGSLRYRTVAFTPYTNHTIDVTGQGFGFVVPRSRWLYADESQKAVLINNAIGGAQSEQANLALFIAELDKSVGLFAKTANEIARAAGEIRSGKFSRAARTLKMRKPRGASRNKAFADNWLKFSYGWGPLVADAVGIMKHISIGARSLSVTGRSRAGSSVPMSGNSQVELAREASSQHRLLATWQYNATWYRMEQVQLVFGLSDWYWDQVSRLGFTNPGSITWETIPLSFVIDWFANIGDLLGSLNLGLTLEYITGSYTEYHRNTGSLTGTPVWTDLRPANFYKYSSISASITPCVFMDYKMRRSVLAKSEVVMTFVLSSPISTNHAITSAALVVQRLK
jgi:hypothetical protein